MAVIVVGAEKGGVGKTCFAVNIAALAMSEGAEVLLIDTDPTGSANTWRRIRSESEVSPEITLMALPENPAKDIARMSEKFELVVVDIGANSRLKLSQSALLADLLLIPTGADQFEVESAAAVFRGLRDMDHRHPAGKVPAYAVLNKMPTNARSVDEGLLREHLEECEIPYLDHSCRSRSAWRYIGRSGLALHEMRGRDKDPKAINEMRAVYDDALQLVAAEEA